MRRQTKQREAERLRQVADYLEQDAKTLMSDNGCYVVPRSQEFSAGLRNTRVGYKARVNSHVPTHMLEYARHLRFTADLLET